ncbi:bifunctional UDP-N-acetylmuramoyl-tripeptide:D-alanyl-D-alanine ligase/alanine racemase [Dysgonomonas sp. 216]|uniref:bifunctional UDP-N-acetylmuramoyl-tripeptide:D-alanyl-D-alanine ligase/alanine racemase n=1 Tax=Dysgonomonas sp. 216 TaxID=2302934 RepID=UPI0013D5CF58|nr:bifunctional UDP-N-acetylmuramoyl-tripeptide:D-alanyl-D-alanine ligase/alanine racemase [Dysgonomonas sp. 216]NDW18221.1 bifunctional UDP-N-acetylmuramoyl-tripeptide:D-alanyl-D-alanine ligase/alanine racemase [Dysgonomonas sp. 216]
MTYTITEIAKVLGCKSEILSNYKIAHLLTDSRNLFYPKETLFFAIQTKNNDGHKFVAELYKLQVRNFVVQKKLPQWDTYTDANFIVVKDTLSALQKLAIYHRKRFDIPVIGITGSNGKTIVKEWIYQMIHSVFNVVRSPRSYNSQIGVPLSVWQLDSDTEIGLFEAGISMPNEMSNLEPIISPTIGVITNIGDAHQENFKNLKQKCLEKLELFRNSDILICKENDRLIDECVEEACLSHKKFTWSRTPSETSPLQIIDVKKTGNSSTIRYSFLSIDFSIEIPYSDEASIENATAAMAVALYLHAPIEIVKERMLTLEPVAMRLDVRQGKYNTVIINDSYNSDINSLKIALDFLVQRSAASGLKKTLILSDILQSGSQTKALYAKVADMVQQKEVNRIIGIGPDISMCGEAFKNIESKFYLSTDEFINSGELYQFHNEIVLLKGSRWFEFERINTLLEQKTHETVLEINLDAIVHNFNFYRSRLKPETKMICMVKADGYGSGASEIAKTLQHHKCDYLAVAIAEEGVVLRKEGIKLPIIVLNPEVNGFDELFDYKLEPEVYNFRILDAFIRESQRRGITDYPIHLKIDTGMHRLGFAGKDIEKLTSILNSQRGLRAQSVFSHLAASESWDFDEFTHEQISTFKEIAKQLEAGCGYPLYHHILNSAGIERFPEEQMDIVRLGISLYGVSASGLKGLQNVCTLKAAILQIKDVPLGETVGYGRKGTLDHDARIATIRIGYADGLSRQFGNKVGQVLINGKLAPIIGNVCMDLSMIDVTGIDAKEGDSVIIFGEEPSLLDLAKAAGTIPYEILTSVSSRVKRIYYKE